MAVQKDGKILVASRTWNWEFNTVRYNSNGSIDETFGTNGFAITSFENLSAITGAIGIRSDGKIVVAGEVYEPYGHTQFAIAQYNADGSADLSFGNAGKTITEPGADHCNIYSLKILPDGKVIVAGDVETTLPYRHDIAAVQYNSDGSLDTGFGSNGIVTSDLGNTTDVGRSVAFQSDGKIILSGTRQGETWDTTDFAAVRYNQNGSIDSSFGTNGVVIIDFDNHIDDCGSVFVLADNSILLGGSTYDLSTNISKLAIVRLKSNGEADSSFGTNGKTTESKADISFTTFSEANGLAVDKNGKIIICAEAYNLVDSRYAVARFNEDGTADNSFGDNGIFVSSVSKDEAVPGGLCVQSDNKILVTGHVNYDILTIRLNNDIVLPITLSSFTATKNSTSVLLSWQTKNELNNDHFIVERNTNEAGNFQVIGTVKSKGNSTGEQLYSFEDFSPANGNNYFRIKQVDINGQATYSKTLTVNFNKALAIKLYPNPVKDNLTIKGLSGISKLTIINASGVFVESKLTADNDCIWNIKQLSAGVYYLKVEVDKKVSTIKFIKE